MRTVKDWNGRILNGLTAYRDSDGFLYHTDSLDLEYSEDAGGYVDLKGHEVLLDDSISDMTVYELVSITMEGDIIEIV
jgi:hypothetical protein